jgi:hypothetical protein
VIDSVWTPIPVVAHFHRSSLVDIGLVLTQTAPETGHVAPVPVGGPIRHWVRDALAVVDRVIVGFS